MGPPGQLAQTMEKVSTGVRHVSLVGVGGRKPDTAVRVTTQGLSP